MSNRNIIVNTSEPKPGILGRGDLFAIAVGMVIGSGMVTIFCQILQSKRLRSQA